MSRIRAAVVGLGRWGPNLARNLHTNDDFELVALCDTDPSRLERAGDAYPEARRFGSTRELLAGTDAELVAVATPVAVHARVAKDALESGRHVLCEKPLATRLQDAAELVETASRRQRRLFVDHTLTYAGAVRAIRAAYVRGDLGQLFYVDSVRINPGLGRPDVDVLWDLAPHDISALRYVLGKDVRSVQTSTHARHGKFVDVAYVAVEFDGGITAHLHLSLLSPVKVRRMIIPGSRALLAYDDLDPVAKLRVYAYGEEAPRAPPIDEAEPLAIEMRDIAGVLLGSRSANGATFPVATGEDGFEVVRVLDAAQRSLDRGGACVTL